MKTRFFCFTRFSRWVPHSCVVLGVVFAVSLAAPGPAQAEVDGPDQMLSALAGSGLSWQSIQKQTVFGLPLFIRSFNSDLAIQEAARQLALEQRLFQRIVVLPGKIIMSGVDGGWHWMAELTGNSRSAGGRVSVLSLTAPVKNTRGFEQTGVQVSRALPWNEQGGQLHWSQETPFGTQTVTQEIYSFREPVNAVKRYFSRRLLESGWRKEGVSDGIPGVGVWRYQHRRITFSVQGIGRRGSLPDARTAVFVHYF